MSIFIFFNTFLISFQQFKSWGHKFSQNLEFPTFLTLFFLNMATFYDSLYKRIILYCFKFTNI
ncbi:hypothetical protein EG346_04835 [Chryseobacterium carnipullorum]|uniref:Uncharacterized protein n=1 Tax=Chryseobacterium carnipullorum TaxID=1124835 RepID=A0A3G6M2S2_CHRCU|nr:hypothetical protein EG346_04835 [Chryseobacterium carnipullorum]AZA66884.1 hypothetical protein EG345_20970 [Chryseobacterium carnipullorum]HBV16982.1 hypothetical protein [Chryseobacterium carnipullorum]